MNNEKESNMSENDIDKNNGIININSCIIWKYAKIVRPYVIEYLKERFPNNLILREFNQIDLVVLKERLPVEIQSTITENNVRIKHSHFENVIRKQLEDNIENYGKCWFFFDAEYYKYLNECKWSVSMNLDWLAKYVKGNKLKIFTVRYDGEIKELKYEDLGFIRKLSNTCKMEYDDDGRVLNRNKIDIMNNVLNGYKFIQEEVDRFIKEFDESDKTEINAFCSYLRNEKVDNRKHLYGNILNAMGHLEVLNNMLDMRSNYTLDAKRHGTAIGIFESSGLSVGTRTCFVDRFNVCQYFPGYSRTKDEWNRIKDGYYTDNMLRERFTAYHDRIEGKQPSLFDY